MAESNFISQQEIWKPVCGYEGTYNVSSYGRVRRIGGSRGARIGKILVPQKGAAGYFLINLQKNGVRRGFLVHRLVCEAFHERDLLREYVNHKDGNKTNNNANNLEWCSRRENDMHKTRVLGKCIGQDHCYAKFTNDQVREIRRRYACGVVTQVDLAKQHNVSISTIAGIINRRSWRHLDE